MEVVGKSEDAFQLIDFILFFIFFAISVGIGSFFAYRDRTNQSKENYYFGERNISPIPLGLSLAVSYVSAITVIAVPAEVYLYGSVFAWHPTTLLILHLVCMIYYVPLFHGLHLHSVFEYLELRFHRAIRLMVGGLGVVSMVCYLAVATFLPALALNTVTPLSLSWTIALTSFTCTFYTSLGGMKAVIWTDVLQCIIMVIGMIALLIRICGLMGGIDNMMEVAEKGGRLNYFNFDADVRIRSTSWAIGIGAAIISSYNIVCNQTFVQRWLSCKTENKARVALSVSLLPLGIFNSVSILTGLAAYAYFDGCDPILTGEISKPDQLIPAIALSVFNSIPGMAGLFVSAAFCGTLSTVSSGINALAAIVTTDFIPIFWSDLSPSRTILLSKIVTFFFGMLTMSVAYIISSLNSNMVGVINSVFGWFAGPIVGIFTMGAFAPWINTKGVVCGSIVSLGCVTWIAVGSMTLDSSPQQWNPLPRSTENCTDVDRHFVNFTTMQIESSSISSIGSQTNVTHGSLLNESLYAISFYSYGTLSFAISTVIAHGICFFTGFRQPVGKEYRLSIPIVRTSWMPSFMNKYFNNVIKEEVPEYQPGKTDYVDERVQ